MGKESHATRLGLADGQEAADQLQDNQNPSTMIAGKRRMVMKMPRISKVLICERGKKIKYAARTPAIAPLAPMPGQIGAGRHEDLAR